MRLLARRSARTSSGRRATRKAAKAAESKENLSAAFVHLDVCGLHELAEDGTLRVWDLADGRVDGIPSASGPKCLYGLGGYKVWLGSVCSDGLRLVSDGRDNALVVHDFGEETSSDIASL